MKLNSALTFLILLLLGGWGFFVLAACGRSMLTDDLIHVSPAPYKVKAR